jgi:hypothetical protein
MEEQAEGRAMSRGDVNFGVSSVSELLVFNSQRTARHMKPVPADRLFDEDRSLEDCEADLKRKVNEKVKVKESAETFSKVSMGLGPAPPSLEGKFEMVRYLEIWLFIYVPVLTPLFSSGMSLSTI